jgi:hypothetical protein
MEPPTILASFTDVAETRICGREVCKRQYRNCTHEEQAKWRRVGSSRNTDGDVARWTCGPCADYYANKLTTHRQRMRTVVSDSYLLMFPLRRYNCSATADSQQELHQ